MPATQRSVDFTKLDTSEGHFSINTNTTKNIRLNVQTYTATTGNQIGVQIKPRQGAASSGSFTGMEISTQVSSTFANTSGQGLIGLKTDCYLRGTTGDITGDVRAHAVELVDDFNSGTASQRTVTGDTCFFWIRPAVSWATTGIYSIFHVQQPDSGTQNPDCFIDFQGEITDVVEITGASASIPANTGYLLINVASTLYRVPVYANS